MHGRYPVNPCLLAAVTAGLLACVVALPAGAQEARVASIPYATPEDALNALRALPQIREREENDWIVLQDVQQPVFWSVTMPANGWHPSIVRRELVSHEGDVRVAMQVRCGASKAACDALVETFKASNESLRMRAKAMAEQLPLTED
jgi:hypothetical protein